MIGITTIGYSTVSARLRLLQRVVKILGAGGVAAVGDHHHDVPAFAHFQICEAR